MPFEASRKFRSKGDSEFKVPDKPEELGDGLVSYHVGESSLVLFVRKGGKQLGVKLDESRGNIAVRPWGEDALETMEKHGVTEVVFQADLLPEGVAVAKIFDSDANGTDYLTVISTAKK